MTHKNNFYALTFIAKDTVGIVSSVTKVLFENGFNIADSSSTLLYGVFSMILIVSSEKDHSEDDIKKMFEKINFHPTVFKYNKSPKNTRGEHYSISVYGADKAGIVHAITSTIAHLKINIVELQTKVINNSEGDVYIMAFEVIAPTGIEESEWQAELKKTAAQIGTDININKIDIYEF